MSWSPPPQLPAPIDDVDSYDDVLGGDGSDQLALSIIVSAPILSPPWLLPPCSPYSSMCLAEYVTVSQPSWEMSPSQPPELWNFGDALPLQQMCGGGSPVRLPDALDTSSDLDLAILAEDLVVMKRLFGEEDLAEQIELAKQSPFLKRLLGEDLAEQFLAILAEDLAIQEDLDLAIQFLLMKRLFGEEDLVMKRLFGEEDLAEQFVATIELAKQSPFLKRLLGEDLAEQFLATKELPKQFLSSERRQFFPEVKYSSIDVKMSITSLLRHLESTLRGACEESEIHLAKLEIDLAKWEIHMAKQFQEIRMFWGEDLAKQFLVMKRLLGEDLAEQFLATIRFLMESLEKQFLVMKRLLAKELAKQFLSLERRQVCPEVKYSSIDVKMSITSLLRHLESTLRGACEESEIHLAKLEIDMAKWEIHMAKREKDLAKREILTILLAKPMCMGIFIDLNILVEFQPLINQLNELPSDVAHPENQSCILEDCLTEHYEATRRLELCRHVLQDYLAENLEVTRRSEHDELAEHSEFTRPWQHHLRIFIDWLEHQNRLRNDLAEHYKATRGVKLIGTTKYGLKATSFQIEDISYGDSRKIRREIDMLCQQIHLIKIKNVRWSKDLEPSGTSRQSVSDVWRHFEKEKISGLLKARCKYCKTLLRGDSKGGTSHLSRHLRGHQHNIETSKRHKPNKDPRHYSSEMLQIKRSRGNGVSVPYIEHSNGMINGTVTEQRSCNGEEPSDQVPRERSRSASRTRSGVWKHFTMVLSASGEVGAKCDSCGSILSGGSKNGTSHLWRHRKSCPGSGSGSGSGSGGVQ